MLLPMIMTFSMVAMMLKAITLVALVAVYTQTPSTDLRHPSFKPLPYLVKA